MSSLCQIIFAWKNTHYIIWKWFLGGGILDWFVGTLALHMLHADIQQDMLLFFAGLWLSVKGTGMIGYTTAIKNLKVKSWSFLLILSVLELILSLGVMISSHMDNNTRIYLAAFSLLLLGSYFFILIFSMKSMEYKEKNHFFYYE
ncbi:MAG: hypothetical protein LBT29_08240 [Flavobacteriaceae bacterium]|nr:hypothetical protein [Flavobacteriaceae bacterium]